MELRNLVTFLKIVETGSFSKAAEQLLYSQSTVTVQIHQLEEELQVRLFDRIGKRVFVTEKGQQLHLYAKQMVDLAQKISLIGEESTELQGTLTIVSYDSLMSAVLPTLLLEYHKRFPKVYLVVKIANDLPSVERFLLQNEADFCFIYLEEKGLKDWKCSFSREEKIVFAVSSKHPLAQQKQISPEQIAKEDIILSNKHSFFTVAMKKQVQAMEKYDIKPAFDIWDATSLTEMMRRGNCVGLVPYYLIAEAEKRGELTALDVVGAESTIWVQALYHPHKLVTPQMKAFFSLLHEFYEP